MRSNIEEWCRRDLLYTGCHPEQLKGMDYFSAYLRYWEQYHLSLAMTGLSSSRNLRIVAFGKCALQSMAQGYHDRFGSGLEASEFQVSDAARQRHPEWIKRSQPAIERIAAAWKLVGLSFPADGIGVCW